MKTNYIVVTGKDLITSGWDEIGRVLTLVSPFISNVIYRINRIDGDREYECTLQSNCRPVLETETIVELDGKMYLATYSTNAKLLRVFNKGKLPNGNTCMRNSLDNDDDYSLQLSVDKIIQQGTNNNSMEELKTTKERVLRAAEIGSTVKEALKTLFPEAFPEAFQEEFKPLSIEDRIWYGGDETMIAQIGFKRVMLIDIRSGNRVNDIVVQVNNAHNISLAEINELLEKIEWDESMRVRPQNK